MKYNRFLPLLIPFLTFLTLQLYFFSPRLIYLALGLITLFFLFLIRQFLKSSAIKENWWNILILPLCFSGGLMAMSVLFANRLIVQLLFLFDFIFLYFYFRAIYFYLLKLRNYQKQSLQNLSSYGNFLAFYFMISALFGFQVYLNIKITYLVLIVFIFTALIVYQVFWSNQIKIRENLLFLFIIIMAIVELSWVASFLTLSFYVLGMIIAVSYYIIIGISRFYLLGILNRKLVKMYLIFGFSSIIVVLLTSRWIMGR